MTPPPTAMRSDLRSAPDRISVRQSASTVRTLFADSASSMRSAARGFFMPKPRATFSATARHTLGEDTRCVLEKCPSLATSLAACRRVLAPQRIEYGRTEDCTWMRFVFIRGIGNVTQGKGPARLAQLPHQRCKTRPHCHDWRCHWNLL